MKLKLLIILLGFNYSIYATSARMKALNQNSDSGSFHFKDSRSVFLNPASMNMVKNYFVTEWGSSGATENIPNAEGGIIFEAIDFIWGVYLGSDINANNSIKDSAGYLTQDNRIDVLFGGDAGFDWGVRGYWAGGEDKQGVIARNSSSVGLGLGVIYRDLEVYTNFDLRDIAEGADSNSDKWEGDLGLEIGTSYYFRGYTVFGNYFKKGFESAVGDITKSSSSKYTVGVGTTYQPSSLSKIFVDIAYFNSKASDEGTSKQELKEHGLPLVIGVEALANDWLEVRASIKQTFLGGAENKDGKFKSLVNSTTVSAGAKIFWGKASIEGVIGESKSGYKNGTFGTTTNISFFYKI